MTGRCLLCSGSSASFANLEPSWSDLAPSISETFFNFLNIPITPEYLDTFRNSAYCDSCFEHVIELYEIVNQLATLEASLTRVHGGIQQSIRQSFSETLNALSPFQLTTHVPETVATTCLRYKLYEAIRPDPPPENETITLYAASPSSPSVPDQSNASVQCEIENEGYSVDIEDLVDPTNELPELLEKYAAEIQDIDMDSEVPPNDPWIDESNETLPSTSYQFHDFVSSPIDSRPETVMMDLVLPKRKIRPPKRYSPEPFFQTCRTEPDPFYAEPEPPDPVPDTYTSLEPDVVEVDAAEDVATAANLESHIVEIDLTEDDHSVENLEPDVGEIGPTEDGAPATTNLEPDVIEIDPVGEYVAAMDLEPDVSESDQVGDSVVAKNLEPEVSDTPTPEDEAQEPEETTKICDTEEDLIIESVDERSYSRSTYIGSLFKCPHADTCKTWLKSEEDIRFHILRHHKGVRFPYKCDQCDKAFEFKNKLTTHYMLHTGERPFMCEHCGIAFRASKHLKEHITVHTGKKRYNCNTCKKGFMSQLSYLAHVRSHTKERPYVCEVCGSGFITNQCLRNHQSKHAELPYGPIECKLCEKRFSSNHNLKTHMKRHNNQYKVYCPTCNKGCDNASQLERHLVCHSKERKFACDQCPKTYLLKCHLMNHKKRHSNTRAFECTVCHRKFFERKALNSHVLIHSGLKPFECVLCSKKFAAKSHLDVHYYSHRTARIKIDPQRNSKSRTKKDSEEVMIAPEVLTVQESVTDPEPLVEQLSQPPAIAEEEQLNIGLQLGDQSHFILSANGNGSNAMSLSDSIHSIVQELNALQTETFIIEIPDTENILAFPNQLSQPLSQPGVTLQCNADGVVEFCTFNLESPQDN